MDAARRLRDDPRAAVADQPLEGGGRGRERRAAVHEPDGAPQLVFFDEDQILPCYLVDRSNHPRAKTALERAVRTIAEATGNALPGDGIPTNSLLAAGASFLDVAATPFVAPFTDAKL